MKKKFARVIVVNQNGQVLVICQSHARVPNYCFPGGKVELAETPRAAASRELYEELGIRISEHRLRHCLTSRFDFGGETWLGYFYICIYNGRRPSIMEREKISSAEFYNFNDILKLPSDKPSFVEVAKNAEYKIFAAWTGTVSDEFLI